jgi:hypothetical protein
MSRWTAASSSTREFVGAWDLVVFHPSGRAALAARHGRRPRDDLLAPGPLGHQLRSTGWRPARYDDGPDRFLTVAERTSPTVSGRRPGRS